MRTRIALLAVVLLFASCTSGGDSDRGNPEPTPAPVEGADEIREAFDAYLTALRDEDPRAASAFIAKTGRAHFLGIASLASTATKDELAGEDLIDAFSAIVMRYVMPPDAIDALSGRDAVTFAIQTSLIGKAASVGQELGDLTRDGEVVTAQVVVEGTPAGFLYTFVEEKGAWKLDLDGVLTDANESFTSLAEDSGLSREEFILTTIENVVGHRPPGSIWKPPN